VAPNNCCVVHTSNASEDGHENPNGSTSAVKHATMRPLSPYLNVWFLLLFQHKTKMFIMFKISFFFDPRTGLHLVLKFKIAQVYAYGSQLYNATEFC
jgi:hypothetical protein